MDRRGYLRRDKVNRINEELVFKSLGADILVGFADIMKLIISWVLFLATVSYALPSSIVDKALRSPAKGVDFDIPQLFSEATTAKIWRVALNLLDEVRCSLLKVKRKSNIISSQIDIPRKSQVQDRMLVTTPWKMCHSGLLGSSQDLSTIC